MFLLRNNVIAQILLPTVLSARTTGIQKHSNHIFYYYLAYNVCSFSECACHRGHSKSSHKTAPGRYKAEQHPYCAHLPLLHAGWYPHSASPPYQPQHAQVLVISCFWEQRYQLNHGTPEFRKLFYVFMPCFHTSTHRLRTATWIKLWG